VSAAGRSPGAALGACCSLSLTSVRSRVAAAAWPAVETADEAVRGAAAGSASPQLSEMLDVGWSGEKGQGQFTGAAKGGARSAAGIGNGRGGNELRGYSARRYRPPRPLFARNAPKLCAPRATGRVPVVRCVPAMRTIASISPERLR